MNPRQFLDEVVRPNIAEFEAEPTSWRRAMNAVLSADALVAHLFEWCKANGQTEELGGAKCDDKFRENLSAKNCGYEVVRDLAKALKHVELDNLPYHVKSAKQVTEGWSAPGAGLGSSHMGLLGSPRMGLGVAGAIGTMHVVVTLDDGSIKRVLPLVCDATDFLERQCAQVGL
jgi:hypothetical protein